MALSEGAPQDRRARHGVEPAQAGRVHIEKINGPMPFELKARRLEYKAGSDLAITKPGLGSLFSYVDIEAWVPREHPLRRIRELVNGALSKLDQEFEALYSKEGRPSIPPERLLRASLLQVFYSIRSERQLMERMDFDLLTLVRGAGGG